MADNPYDAKQVTARLHHVPAAPIRTAAPEREPLPRPASWYGRLWHRLARPTRPIRGAGLSDDNIIVVDAETLETWRREAPALVAVLDREPTSVWGAFPANRRGAHPVAADPVHAELLRVINAAVEDGLLAPGWNGRWRP